MKKILTTLVIALSLFYVRTEKSELPAPVKDLKAIQAETLKQNVYLKTVIEECRTNYEGARKNFTPEMEKVNNNEIPCWLENVEDVQGYTGIIDDQDIIYEHGKVVWGSLVMANQNAFKPGTCNMPGLVTYSLDPYYDAHFSDLKKISKFMYYI